MIVSDIQTRVKRTFGDESGVQVTDTDIIRWINDGQRQIVLQNEGLLETTATADAVSGQQEYALPADTLIFRSVKYKTVGYNAYYHMKGFSFNEFNEYIDGWEGEAYVNGIPEIYTLYAGNLILFPIPSDSFANALKIYYNRKPIEVETSVDTPDLPELYHESLVKYCLQQAYELDEDLEAAGAKSQELVGDIQLLRGRQDWKNQETYPTITVLMEDDF